MLPNQEEYFMKIIRDFFPNNGGGSLLCNFDDKGFSITVQVRNYDVLYYTPLSIVYKYYKDKYSKLEKKTATFILEGKDNSLIERCIKFLKEMKEPNIRIVTAEWKKVDYTYSGHDKIFKYVDEE